MFSATPKPPSASSLVANQLSPPNASVVPGGGVPLYRGKPSNMVSPYQHRRPEHQKVESNPLVVPGQQDESSQPVPNPTPPKSKKGSSKSEKNAAAAAAAGTSSEPRKCLVKSLLLESSRTLNHFLPRNQHPNFIHCNLGRSSHEAKFKQIVFAANSRLNSQLFCSATCSGYPSAKTSASIQRGCAH